MNGEFGLTGYCHIKIKKADGRVLTQGKKNRLTEGVATNLGARIFSSSNQYSASYVPKKLEVYVKGYGGSNSATNNTIWKSDALTAEISEGSVDAIPRTQLFASYADLTFDGGSNFANNISADGETSQIYGVRLLADNGTVIGQALYGDVGSGYATTKFGFASLKGEVGPGAQPPSYVIDNNDEVTITYTIYFDMNPVNITAGDLDRSPTAFTGSDAESLLNYLKALRDTVKGTSTEDISLKSAAVYWAGDTSEESKTVPTLSLDTFNLTTDPLSVDFQLSGVPAQPRGRGAWVYFGAPAIRDYTNNSNPAVPDIKAVSGNAKDVTDKALFSTIPASALPTRVTVFSAANRVIFSFGISPTDDITSWTSGDSIEFSFYMLVSVNYPLLINADDEWVDVPNQETTPSDPLNMTAG